MGRGGRIARVPAVWEVPLTGTSGRVRYSLHVQSFGHPCGCPQQDVFRDCEVIDMTDDPRHAKWNVADCHNTMLIDGNGEQVGKLQDVDVDVETDVPQFATVEEGPVGRHLTFVPLGGIQVGPHDLQVAVTKEQVRSAPDMEMHGEELSQAGESTLDHHVELNGTPISTEIGRRLARR